MQVTLLASVVAFSLGAVDELPSVRWFSAFASLNTLLILIMMVRCTSSQASAHPRSRVRQALNGAHTTACPTPPSLALLQMTAFVAFMVLTERRIAAGCFDFACCCRRRAPRAVKDGGGGVAAGIPVAMPVAMAQGGPVPPVSDGLGGAPVSAAGVAVPASAVAAQAALQDDHVADENTVKKVFRLYCALRALAAPLHAVVDVDAQMWPAAWLTMLCSLALSDLQTLRRSPSGTSRSPSCSSSSPGPSPPSSASPGCAAGGTFVLSPVGPSPCVLVHLTQACAVALQVKYGQPLSE